MNSLNFGLAINRENKNILIAYRAGQTRLEIYFYVDFFVSNIGGYEKKFRRHLTITRSAVRKLNKSRKDRQNDQKNQVSTNKIPNFPNFSVWSKDMESQIIRPSYNPSTTNDVLKVHTKNSSNRFSHQYLHYKGAGNQKKIFSDAQLWFLKLFYHIFRKQLSISFK